MSSSSHNILIISEDTEESSNLRLVLRGRAFAASVASDIAKHLDQIEGETPDLLLIDQSVISQNHSFRNLTGRGILPHSVPVILILSPASLKSPDGIPHADDFVIKPFTIDELAARIEHALRQRHPTANANLIRCGDLTIDLEKCQVSVANQRIALTFTEYELLKLLTMNNGMVFTRQSLLNIIWDKDYHGGDRTVDVHIRRLRSKIEIGGHSFVETVRNVGYRLKTDV